MPKAKRAAGVAVTVLLAAVGGGVFAWLGLPAAWLSGAMVLCTIGALAKWGEPLPELVRQGVMVPLGIVMGSSVTPNTLSLMASWPGSMFGLAVAMVAIIIASSVLLHAVFGWNRLTAFYASTPGAMSTILILAQTAGADVPKVAVAQVSRVFLLVAVVPFIATMGNHATVLLPDIPAAQPQDFLVLVGVGTAAGIIAERLGMPGGLLLGAFFASAILHGTDVSHAVLPWWVVDPAYAALGATIGARFGSISVRALVAAMGASLASFLLATAIAVAASVAAGRLLGVDPLQVFIAYAPGGLEAMTIIAFTLHLDAAYVGVHHLARFLALSLTLPAAARLYAGRRDK